MKQLREKQKARRIYGVLEKQSATSTPRPTARTASRARTSSGCSEQRLDNVVFRANYRGEPQPGPPVRPSRPRARERKRVTIPSFKVRKDDVVEIGPKAKSFIVVRHNADTIDRAVPMWLEATSGELKVDGARPAAPGGRSTSRSATADRRALLASSPRVPPHRTPSEEFPMLIIQRPEVESANPTATRSRSSSRRSSPLRPHPRQPLRRALLSSDPGAAITQVRFDEALHEFDTIPG